MSLASRVEEVRFAMVDFSRNFCRSIDPAQLYSVVQACSLHPVLRAVGEDERRALARARPYRLGPPVLGRGKSSIERDRDVWLASEPLL